MPKREGVSIPIEEIPGILSKLDHEQHFGYVPFAKSGLHVHMTGSRVSSMLIDAVQSIWGGQRVPDWDDERILSTFDDADALDFTIMVHELVHVLQARSTPLGIYVDLAGTSLVESWMRVLALREDFNGSRSALIRIASSRTSPSEPPSEDREAARTALRMLQILADAGLGHPPPRLHPRFHGLQLVYDDADGGSYLDVGVSDDSTATRIRVDYRLVTENLAYTIQACLHNRFEASKQHPYRIHPFLMGLTSNPTTAFYHVLIEFIDSLFDGTDAYHDRLAEIILELSLMYGAYLTSDGAFRSRPLAVVLQTLIDAASSDDAPSLNSRSHKALVSHCHDYVRHAPAFEPWPVSEATYEELVDVFSRFVSERLIQEGTGDGPWSKWESAKRLLAKRRTDMTISSKFVEYPALAIVEAAFNGTPIYSPFIVVAHSSDVLAIPETGHVGGLNLQEYDLHIIFDLLLEREPRCPHNHAGVCRGVLYGLECDDSAASDNQSHPCGFFDQRAMALLATRVGLRKALNTEVSMSSFNLFEIHVSLGIVGMTLSCGDDDIGASSRRLQEATNVNMADPFLALPDGRREEFERNQRDLGLPGMPSPSGGREPDA